PSPRPRPTPAVASVQRTLSNVRGRPTMRAPDSVMVRRIQGGTVTMALGTDHDLSQRLFDALVADYPDHEVGTRPVHTIGVGARGYFTPSNAARKYCVAEQFAGPSVPVTIRFSNGSGSPVEHDDALDVRGMAAKFHLASGTEADLVMI